MDNRDRLSCAEIACRVAQSPKSISLRLGRLSGGALARLIHRVRQCRSARRAVIRAKLLQANLDAAEAKLNIYLAKSSVVHLVCVAVTKLVKRLSELLLGLICREQHVPMGCQVLNEPVSYSTCQKKPPKKIRESRADFGMTSTMSLLSTQSRSQLGQTISIVSRLMRAYTVGISGKPEEQILVWQSHLFMQTRDEKGTYLNCQPLPSCPARHSRLDKTCHCAL